MENFVAKKKIPLYGEIIARTIPLMMEMKITDENLFAIVKRYH